MIDFRIGPKIILINRGNSDEVADTRDASEGFKDPNNNTDGRVSRMSSILVVKTEEPLEELIDRKMTPKSFYPNGKIL